MNGRTARQPRQGPPWRALRYAAVMFGILSVPLVLTVVSYDDMRRDSRVPLDSLGQMLWVEAAFWYAWMFVIPLIDRQVRRSRPVTAGDTLQMLGGHVVLLLTFAVGHTLLVIGVARVVGSLEQSELARALIAGLIPHALFYAVLAAAFSIAEGRRRSAAAALGLRAEVAEARLDALRQQLNPHFLFNTLNHIVVQLRARKVDPALDMLLALSELLRRVLREHAHLIPLHEELRIVEQYLEIERARFGDRLVAELTFSPATLDILVPSLLLQPLVENAMHHGISETDGGCRLQLSARVDGQRLRLEIRDMGPGADPARIDAAPGIGLRNTRERLKYLYGEDHAMTLTTQPAGGLLIALDLPARKQER